MKRRTEILIEIEREIVITQRKNGLSWCVTCGKQVPMLTASEAAQIIKTDESVIYQSADSGELHFAATTEGLLLICPESLLTLRDGERGQPPTKLLISEAE